MQQAENIARLAHKSTRMAVISGVGTRQYYRKLGYELEGPYMVKSLVGGEYKGAMHYYDRKNVAGPPAMSYEEVIKGLGKDQAQIFRKYKL